ncbi:Uncharacterised protein [Salmonella enterica subsp. enterica serovar Bovismorbificans]|nr:Uncharacterised protein [Salmonella enterica subsp. enterica serovar Bovismorbificans]
MQPLHQHIATTFILLGDIAHALLIAFQSGDSRHLKRGKGAIIVITFNARQRADQGFIAHHKPNTPARHIIAFRQCEKFNRHVARAGHLHNGWRFPAVVHDIGIRQIVHYQHIITFSQSDHFFKKFQFDALSRRVRRKTQNHHFRFRITFANSALQLVEEIHPLDQWNRTHLRPGDNGAIDMNRVTGVRHQYRIAMIQRRQH